MGAVCRWILAWGARWGRVSGLLPPTGIFTKRSLKPSLRRDRLYSCILLVCPKRKDTMAVDPRNEILMALLGGGGEEQRQKKKV